ncbi:MAG TPA: hypothetical protein VGB13_08485 [Candidatus Krumholzibacteria bacterium]
MFGQMQFGREFFASLERLEEEITLRVAAANCAVCGGPLHRSDYERKPRGGLIAPEGESAVVRFSLCCGREGCRKRATPPSLRFLGRRVYLGVVVIVASIVAQALATQKETRRATGVPGKTVRRWLGWWRGPFLRTEAFVTICALLNGVAVSQIPASIGAKLKGSPEERVRTLLRLLAPLTTSSVRDGSRYLGVVS